MALGRLVIDLAANVASLQRDLGKASQQITKFADGAKGALSALGVGISVAGIGAFVKATIDAADRLNDLRMRTGLTGQQLLVLEGAALRGGGSIEVLEGVVSKLARRLGEARKGTGDAAEAYRALGISVENSGGGLKTIDQILREVGAKFRTFENGAGKAELAVAALGKGGDTLIPMIENIEETEERFRRLGITIDEQLISAADEFNDSLEDLKVVMDVISRQVISALLPHLQQLVTAMTDSAASTDAFKGSVDTLLAPLKFLASGVIGSVSAIAALTEVVVGFSIAQRELTRGNLTRAFEEMEIAAERASNRLSSAGGVIKGLFSDPERRAPTERPELRPPPRITDQAAAKAAQDALFALQTRQAKISLDLVLDAAKREQSILDAKYQDALVGELEYWTRKQEIQRAATDAELRALQVQADRQRQLVEETRKRGTSTKEYLDAVGTLDEILAKRNKLELDFATQSTLGYMEAKRSADQYKREVGDLNAQLLELQGLSGDAAAQRLALANEPLRRRFSANSDVQAIATLDAVERLTIAQARFNQQRDEQEQVSARLAIQEERIQNSLRTGALSELDALKQTGEARAAAVRQMDDMVRNLERVAEASGNPRLILQAEQARAALERLRSETDLLAEKFDTIFKDSFADAFADFVSGTKSAKDAFKAFADSVTREINRIVAQSIATDISNAIGLGGGRGAGGGFGGILATIFGGRASGGAADAALLANQAGLVGSFASGTDFVPRTGLALVHAGERIIPANQNRGGPSVVMNVYAQDADSFRRSQGQIMASLESAAARARRKNG